MHGLSLQPRKKFDKACRGGNKNVERSSIKKNLVTLKLRIQESIRCHSQCFFRFLESSRIVTKLDLPNSFAHR